MRDALSLLDMLLSYESQELTAAALDELVPPPHDELASAVVECVSKRDAAGALKALDRALQSGRTVERFCEHLIEYFRTLMVLRVCDGETDLVDVVDAQRASLKEQATRFDAPTYVYMISLLEELRRQVRSSGAGRALADAAIVRLAMSRQFTDLGDLLAKLGESPAGGATAPSTAPAKKNETDAVTTVAAQTLLRPGPVMAAAKSVVPSSRDVGRSAARAVAAPPLTPVVPSARVTSAEWERVSMDPLIRKVKDAVEGTLLDVRPTPPNAASGVEAGTAEDLEPRSPAQE
jgi:DNA polymerase III gamma/tau subunit